MTDDNKENEIRQEMKIASREGLTIQVLKKGTINVIPKSDSGNLPKHIEIRETPETDKTEESLNIFLDFGTHTANLSVRNKIVKLQEKVG